VNDAPTIAASSHIPVAPSGTTAITGVSLDDPDAADAELTATLSVGIGTLAANGDGYFVSVTGSGTGSITLKGSRDAINSLIADGRVSFTNPGTRTSR
jgi:hypothetical protein